MIEADIGGPRLDQSVDDVMRLWPATIRVFIAYRMGCVGCPVGGLHTVADACAAYGFDPAVFLAELCRTAGRPHA